MASRDKFNKEIDESQDPPLRKWYLKNRLRDREAENGRAPPPAQSNPNLDRGYMKLPLEVKILAHRFSPTLTTAMNWLLADSQLYNAWSPFAKDNMVDNVARISLGIGRSKDLLNRLFTPHTQHIVLRLLRYPDPYMPMFAEPLDKIDKVLPLRMSSRQRGFSANWDAAPTVTSLPEAERERIISAAWLFEYTAITVRQIGWFDYGGDPTNPEQYYQRGWAAAHTKNQVSMSHSACQNERLACIYNYVRGLYKQIFHSLEEEFIEEFRKRVASHEAGTLGVPPDDKYEVQYTWRTLQASKDPECFPKIFISRVAQREYIDVLCSFGLRFLYHVLRMSQADRRKMIVRTFHPIRGLQSEPMSVEEPIFRRVLGTERDHWELKPGIVVNGGAWSDGPSDAAGYFQNMAWVNYHVRRRPQDPNNWKSFDVNQRYRVNHDFEKGINLEYYS
ncbi:hypothetical protein DL766_007866 [Monosporascus sp. MC13-8B]|uniref:Uncharacterized protein n=1 Tax=Monosporascus cannonballus TaxID=155416 RepID=A0ABY0H2R6_9PEZI|nr:hypothetical protein DL763_009402 [Monosporascus cannonballus]RYO83302.1 hypothetical protein DL762_006211 [Monosporascus cannonballus]RYP21776.1 hypothetical protein DL766_007866 [Monosporascus sp. MC13-8B]